MVRTNLTLLIWGLLVVMACAGGTNENHVRHSSRSVQFNGYGDGRPTEQVQTIEFTMPRGLTLDTLGGATVIDQKGRRFRATTAGLSRSLEEERFRGTFEVAEDSDVGLLHVGGFEIDLQTSSIRRMQAAAAAR